MNLKKKGFVWGDYKFLIFKHNFQNMTQILTHFYTFYHLFLKQKNGEFNFYF